jgi:photosystem II stability/assembly factor-like uncharacterized protein
MNTAPVRTSRTSLLPYLLALCVLGTGNCGSCAGGGGGGGSYSSGGGSWLVGQSGTMLNVIHDRLGDIGHYGLDVDDDLLGIACRGTQEAWVVGSSGVILATIDAGKTWRVQDPGNGQTLRAVALAATSTVFVAGDGGVFRVTVDGGQTWRDLTAPAQAFTSVAARRKDGQVALLASREGLLFRYDATRDLLSRASIDGDAGTGPGVGAALFSVVLSRDGQTAVAVGEGGRMLISRDGGLSFWSQTPVVADAIRDVWLVGEQGNRFVAVGDAGLVMDGATGGVPTVRSRLADGASLRALHLEASGHGAIVGDRGTLLFTEDGGQHWKQLATGETRDLYGLDALDVGPHL